MTTNEQQQRNVSDIVFREDLYPRIAHDPALVQLYAENLDVMPPIEVNQHNELLDGFHRWTAHRKQDVEKINVKVTETKNESEFYALAIRRNANHGKQMSEKDKKSAAIQLYNGGTGRSKDEIADLLSVSKRHVNNFLNDIDKQRRQERKETIFNMWMACHTQQEIADAVGLTQKQTNVEIEKLYLSETLPKGIKLQSEHADDSFKFEITTTWSFGKKTNEVAHFGNTEVRIVDQLLYQFTKPFDIVFDPFGGGGSTIDICKKRLRRYYVSDRKPIVEREKEIRKHDINDGLPKPAWSDVKLTYLDPPYWIQAENQYSEDPEDLGNMSLEDFTNAMASTINKIAAKQASGYIALIIQPTHWKAPGRTEINHVRDIDKKVNSKHLQFHASIDCPYSTEQLTPQMVNWAKENKTSLKCGRNLIVWRIVK